MRNRCADRVNQIEDSITLKVAALAGKLKREGQDVIDFGAGEPDFDTPDAIKEAAIAAIHSGKTKYTVATGIVELKEAICQKLLTDNQLQYGPQNIVVSAGAKHSIYNVMQALVNPGDEVLVPAPYWVSYPDQITLAGGTPKIIATTEKTRFKITPEQLASAIGPKTKGVIINSPSNPTGMIYTPDELKALGQIIHRTGIWVLSDEIYEKLSYGAHQAVSIVTVCPEIYDQTIVINGMSKAYAMTDWRIGYLTTAPNIIKTIAKLQNHSTSNPTSITQ